MRIDYNKFFSHVIAEYSCFNKQEKIWIKRMFTWLNPRNSTFDLDDYFKNLARIGLINYKQELLFITSLVNNAGIFVSHFRIRKFKQFDADTLKKQKRPKLALTSQIKFLLSQLRGADKLFIAILASSGRRGKDIQRLSAANISYLNDRYICQIPRDKCNSLPVSFSFDWDPSLNLDEEAMNQLMQSLSADFSFDKINRQMIARKAKSAGFDLHSLRHRCCIRLIRYKFTVDEILSQIGWKSIDSFIRYSKLSIIDIKKFSSLDSVLTYINTNFNK